MARGWARGARGAISGAMLDSMTKGAFARAAGVGPSAITKALRGDLADALTPDRKQLYPDHPAARAYLQGSPRAIKQRERPSRKRSSPRNGGKLEMLPGEDVFTFSQRMANAQSKPPAPTHAPPLPEREPVRPPPLADDDEPPLWLGTKPGSLAAWSRKYLYDVEKGIAGQFPEEINDLGGMTLREVVDRFGSIELLGGLVKLLAQYATMQDKEAAAAKRRGELIPRSVLTVTVMPLVDLAFKRLVGEAPGALAEQVIARVLSASGEGKTGDLRLDIEALIRRENSTILGNCRDRVLKEID